MCTLILSSIPFKAMGSPCELKIYCRDKKQKDKLFKKLTSEINRLEEKYTRFKSSSVTSTINNGAGHSQAIAIDHETAQLLHYADVLYQQSDGLFDITSGVLRRAWDFKSNKLPSPLQLDSLLPLIGWDKVIRDEYSIQLPIEGMEIDFGGFVKEYTADVIATLCLDNGISHGLVNLGGDIRIIGPHPDDSPWRVGIQHPRKPQNSIAVVDMYAGGIATSGDYERYMIIDGIRYCHLLSPFTGKSIQPEFASISVISDTCLLAGSLSTTTMLKSKGQTQWLEETELPHLKVDQTMKVSGSLKINFSDLPQTNL
ncbi:MAG: FAD:protein FMN transferase [Cellvibrionaceae bacterium]